MRTEFQFVTIDIVYSKTDKAAQVSIDGRDMWIPLSVVDGDVPVIGDGATVSIAKWFAEREDLPEAEEDAEPNVGGLAAHAAVTMFTCRPKREAGIRHVSHKVFGVGTELSVAGDKSTMRFDEDGKTRTLLSKFLNGVQ